MQKHADVFVLQCNRRTSYTSHVTFTDELAAYKLAQLPFPGVFGVFYESDRPSKNALEKKWIETTREKTGNASDLEILQKTFDRMK